MSLELAAEAVAVVAPFLTEAGKEAAKEMGKDAVAAGGKLLGWLRGHLSGRGAALAELEAKPQSEARQLNLKGQLASLLEDQPALADELRALLPAAKVSADTMTLTIGDNSQGAQIKGDRNTVTFR